VDGNNVLGLLIYWNFKFTLISGPVVGNFCTQLAIQLAKEHGIGWVVCKGSNHYGICGFYTLQMADEGLVVSVSDVCN
jgi:LDH2 family malate/lactate/ureidoglycolate dehydrogenase